MESLILLLVLVAIGIPIAAVAGLVVALGARDSARRAEHRLALIEGRLALLEARPKAAAAEPAAPPPVEEPGRPAPAEPAAPMSSEAAPPEPAAEEPPAVEAPPVPPAPTPPPAPPPAPPASPSFEEAFGTRWAVRIGGLALALGGIFLVRYSIEQGLIGPGLRVFFGALLAAALLAGGEWTRRQEQLAGLPGLPTAHIPSILTAAGTTVAYATVYSAYALYGFLPPAAAFLLLGVVALLTLAAALLHGPALAALGLVGAYVTPVLVSTGSANYWALYLYLAVVSAGAYGLARIRLWRWLAVTAVVFGVLWMLPGLDGVAVRALGPHLFHGLAGFALVALLIVSGLAYGPPTAPGRIDGVSSGALIANLFATALVVVASRHDGFALSTFALLVAATVGIAWRAEAATAAVPGAALLAALVIAAWAVDIPFEHLLAPGGLTVGQGAEPVTANATPHLLLGAGFAALFGAAGFFAQGRSERAVAPVLWAAAGAAAPIAILLALNYRVAGLERSIPFAGLALLLAAAAAAATEKLTARPPRPGLPAAAAIFATGAVAALALAFTFAMEKGWLTVGLALMVPGIAWVEQRRPLPALRFVAAAVVALVLARIAWEPRIVGDDVGATPVFNWLLYGYGGPAAAFWLGGFLLRRRADDLPARMVESAAILFTVLLALFEIRHAMNDGDVYRDDAGLGELGLDVCVGLALAIGLERVRGRTGSIVHNAGALIIAALTAAAIVFGLFLGQNPLFTGDPVGGRFFNLILIGYGLPAVLAAILALVSRGTRPQGYRVTGAVLSVALALAYLSLEVRTLYQGEDLASGATSEAEQYTYSAVWLAFGVAVLLAGMLLRSQPVRLVSAAVILITVAKVFLLDLAGLEGVYRALSFIGLGLVLVGIGLLYQRLLFPPQRPSAPPPPSVTAT